MAYNPTMPNIPAYCETCKKWSPGMVQMENSTNVFIGSNYVPCRHCGMQISEIPGTYNVINGTIEVIRSLDLTESGLKELSKILQTAIEQKTPAAELRRLLQEHNPRISAQLNKFVTDNPAMVLIFNTLVAFVLGMVTTAATIALSSGVSNEDIERQIEADRANVDRIVRALTESNSPEAIDRQGQQNPKTECLVENETPVKTTVKLETQNFCRIHDHQRET